MSASVSFPISVADEVKAALVAGDHANPHQVLGIHPALSDGRKGAVVRAFHPEAVAVTCLTAGGAIDLVDLDDGLFGAFVPDAAASLSYRLRFEFRDGNHLEREDPYRFAPTLGELDQHLIAEGNHRQLWKVLGAHSRVMDGVAGTAFAVWAPNARRVSVVGDFVHWDGRQLPMRSLGETGIFELFVPGVGAGDLYKFEVKAPDGSLCSKADPLALAMEHPPGSACRVVADAAYAWGDAAWIRDRETRDPAREPLSIYEVHLGSWARVPEEGDRVLSYRELAPRLVAHMQRFGFTHLELLPVAEHPYAPSWGYQVSGYYAPTARFGDPDDLRFLIDTCHQAGLGVIVDWVPAHFPRDAWALARFDGTALYEHEDPRQGEHPDWGTLIFNFGRAEVRNFLLANALFWIEEFHVDGLRVDAVASMLYLDYSREHGEWVPNAHGGRENFAACDFLRATNEVITSEHAGCMTIAEESTDWGGVTRPVAEGGLGFSFKWNMGWMHDTLQFLDRDPIYRSYHQHQLTFAMLYEYSERFIMPLSHDEVVHGKGSLYAKMPGDPWQKLANLRLLLAYQYTRPGKMLNFMGVELAQSAEWNADRSLDWHLEHDPARAASAQFLADLGQLYLELPALWRRDHEPEGFRWVDCDDNENSVISYLRRDGEEFALVVINLTPVARYSYRIGVPRPGRYRCLLDSDDARYGGSEVQSLASVEADPEHMHGFAHSLSLVLPPLAALVFTLDP